MRGGACLRRSFFADVRGVFLVESEGDCLARACVPFVGRLTDVPVNILDGLVRDLLSVACSQSRSLSEAECGSAWLLPPIRGQYSEPLNNLSLYTCL
jgi:hypothetical protein